MIFVSYTVNSSDFTIHALKEKKKKKTQNAETRNPNDYLVLVWIALISAASAFPQFFFFFFFSAAMVDPFFCEQFSVSAK